MTDAEIDLAALQAEQQKATEEAQARFEKTLREACLQLNITGGNVDEILQTGVLTLNGVEVILIAGTIADPWMLQIITDVGDVPEGVSSEDFHKGLLLANLMMVGSHSLFSLSPASGRGIMLRYLPMYGEDFNADTLAGYLKQLTQFHVENQGKSPMDPQFQAGALFV